MTDEELIARLRWKAGAYAKEAADRIEALVRERGGWSAMAGDRHAKWLSEKARAERLEAALRAVITAKGLTDPAEHGYEAIVAARAALEGGAA